MIRSWLTILKRHRLLVVGLVLFSIAGAFASQTAVDVGPSTQTREPHGLRALLQYLRAQGYDAHAHKRPLVDLTGPPGTLVIANPVAEPLDSDDRSALVALVEGGWRLIYLTSGGEAGPPESLVLADLGMTAGRLHEPPLTPVAWRAWQLEETSLVPSEGDAPALASAPSTHAVVPPVGQTSWFETEAGVPQVFSVPRGDGEIIVINNASIWGNAWLSKAGNLALAEQLLGEGATSPVLFDEWHHGHKDAIAEEIDKLLRPTPLFLVHLLWIYFAAVWAVSRPFGAALRSAGYVAGATERDLMAVASLHRRSNHAAEAGSRLLALARDGLARRRVPPDDVDLPDHFDGDAKGLEALARRVADLQQKYRF